MRELRRFDTACAPLVSVCELATMLCAEARRRFPYNVWLRVVPENGVAIAAYARAGFVRASAPDEEAFNRDQPRTYVWMRAG